MPPEPEPWDPDSGFVPPADDARYQPWPPVGTDQRRPVSGRRMLAIVAAAVGGSLMLAVLCAAGLTLTVRAADGDLTRRVAPPAPTFAMPTAAPFDGTYVAPVNLCLLADFTRMRPLFTAIGDIVASTGTAPREASVSSCDGTSGNDGVSGAFHLSVSVYPDPVHARAAFEEGRADSAVGPVADLGEAGYAYRDRQGGNGVLALDANLTITMTWRDTGPAAPDPVALQTTMVAVCRTNLGLLRFG